ncbi:MAG: hypothetical protein ACTSVE_05625, partial [Candidatus Helarchaeota archaeon]
MNEAEVLIYYLTRKNDNQSIGATSETLMNGLGLTDRNAYFKLLNLLKELESNLSPFGMVVKFNPINQHWYLGLRDSLGSNTSDPELTKSNAATLFAILVRCFTGMGKISLQDLKKIRQTKNLLDDLNALENLGYIVKNGNIIQLTPKIFYFVDIDELAEQIKKINEYPDRPDKSDDNNEDS